LAKLQEGLPEQYKFIETMAEGPDKKRLMAQFSKTLTPEEKGRKVQLEKFYNAEIDKLVKSGVITSGGAPTAPAQSLPSVSIAVATISQFIQRNPKDPRIPGLIEDAKSRYKDVPGSSDRIDASVARTGWKPEPSAPNTPGEMNRRQPTTTAPASASAPVPVVTPVSTKNTKSELPTTYGPTDLAKDLAGLDWSSPEALAKDLYSKIYTPSNTGLSDERARDLSNFMKKGGS
jgi:hypothetical protein